MLFEVICFLAATSTARQADRYWHKGDLSALVKASPIDARAVIRLRPKENLP